MPEVQHQNPKQRLCKAHDTLEGHAIEGVYLPFVNINLLFDTFGSFLTTTLPTLFKICIKQ